MAQCNYCSLKELEQVAEQQGHKVTLIKEKNGWTHAFLHPPGVTKEDIIEERKTNLESQYFRAAFMKLPQRCCC